MKVSVLSNLVIDEIVSTDLKASQSLGGPAAYCGMTARKFGFDTTLFTHFGKDIDSKYLDYLKNHGIIFNTSSNSDLPTTRFVLKNFTDDRELTLKTKCSAIDIEEIKNVKSNCWIISPVFDEVSPRILQHLCSARENNQFIMLDPQGFTRICDPTGRIYIRKNLEIPINNINGIKLDTLEISCLTNGLQGKDGVKKIRSKYGIDHVLYTQDHIIHLLQGDRLFWLNVPKVDTLDSTGLGDIMASSFACTIVKEKDPLWAFCFAAGALSGALKTREIGIEKIPSISDIEENATYYYNLLNYDVL